jgi:hypothetical protein
VQAAASLALTLNRQGDHVTAEGMLRAEVEGRREAGAPSSSHDLATSIYLTTPYKKLRSTIALTDDPSCWFFARGNNIPPSRTIVKAASTIAFHRSSLGL